MITGFGIGTAFLAVVGIVYALVMKFARPDVTIEGWTFIVISLLLIGGVQLIMLGILGSYIGRIYVEVQDRPLYVVRERIGDFTRATPS
uniref:CAZy families GT2 protein n=1 Tax=uncultured Saccharopolyspora sp. TaxID=498730 RepID=A0A060BZX7_9PSEU|nr:CAZy families GT2 protein [uncultured Saccharopolyspora sp.]